MAACLITVSGTSGQLELNYKIAGVSKSPIISGVGSFYIEDTATNVTYTTTSGNVTASSSCLTVTSLAFTCYNLKWKGLNAPNYQFVSVTLGNNIYSFTAPFPNSEPNLSEAINSLNTDKIKITGYKLIVPLVVFPDTLLVEHNFLIRVIGKDIPIFKIKNAENTAFIYLYGVTFTCTPEGYTSVDMCVSTPLL